MKKSTIPLLLAISTSSFASSDAFICSENIQEKAICDVTKQIQAKVNKYKFQDKMMPILHKKLLVKRAVLVRKSLKLDTVFSEAIDSKKLKDQEFKKNTINQVKKKVCSDRLFKKYISLGGKITIKYSLSDGSTKNLPSPLYLSACNKI